MHAKLRDERVNDMLTAETIGFIGGGNMAEALIGAAGPGTPG